MKLTCSSCRYYMRKGEFTNDKTGEEQALCLRYPPVFLGTVADVNSHEGFGQPFVTPSEWCGEWKAA